MRGDLEILAYNLIQWHCGQLPWEKGNLLNNPAKVQEAKEESMKNVDKFMKTCFDKNIPAPIHAFVKYVSQMKYNDKPDYPKIRKIFEQGLKALGKPDSGPLDFSNKAVANGKQEKNTINKAKRDSRLDEIEIDQQSPVKRPRAKKTVPIEIQDDSSPEIVAKKSKKATRENISSPEVIPAKKSRKFAQDEPPLNEPSTSKDKKKPDSQSSVRTGTVTLNSNTNSKRNKKIELNLELDISIDADVVINLHRRDKKKEKDQKDKEKEKEKPQEKPKPTSKTDEKPGSQKKQVQIDKSIVEEISDSENEDDSFVGKYRNRVSPRRQMLNRAGEYKGKKAKNT